jgi:hypothetical protein
MCFFLSCHVFPFLSFPFVKLVWILPPWQQRKFNPLLIGVCVCGQVTWVQNWRKLLSGTRGFNLRFNFVRNLGMTQFGNAWKRNKKSKKGTLYVLQYHSYQREEGSHAYSFNKGCWEILASCCVGVRSLPLLCPLILHMF